MFFGVRVRGLGLEWWDAFGIPPYGFPVGEDAHGFIAKVFLLLFFQKKKCLLSTAAPAAASGVAGRCRGCGGPGRRA